MAEQITVKGAIKRNYSRYTQRLKSIICHALLGFMFQIQDQY